jgi:ABC-2 type transport system permease protein
LNIVWSICRRDLLQAFTTPLAWLVLACWCLLTNGVFVLRLYQVHGTPGSESPLFVNALSAGVFFLTLLAPALSMTSFSGERVQGTMQLLLTVPIREWQLVLGKFLGVFGVLAALVAATALHPLVLAFISEVHLPHLLAGYLGLLLTCAFFAGVGVWISLLVDTPMAAYVITFAVLAVLILLGFLEQNPVFGPLGQAIGLTPRVSPFFSGEIRLGNVLYLGAMTSACLVLAHASLCARRIHG